MPKPVDGLSPTELEAWIMVTAFGETIPPSIDAHMKSELGVNMFEYTVMAMLSEEPTRTLQMTALAKVSFGSISRLSHAVARLEKRGWVEKQAGEGRRRHNVVCLTDQGLKALTAAAPNHIAEVRRTIIDPLTAAEVESLSTILAKLIGARDADLATLLAEQIPNIIERNKPQPR